MARRILIDPGSHHLLNLGDVAMLQVCVERLRRLWHGPNIRVLTAAPDLLARFCPGVAAVDANGRYELLTTPSAPRGPRALARASLALEGRRRRGAAGAYVRELLAADLFLASGRGGLTDAFADESRALLAELELAHATGLPTALVGQGVGPLDDPTLRAHAARVLPSVELIALREGDRGQALLAASGVDATRVVVTGDDAVELASSAPREPAAPPRLGINLRVAPYAGIETSDAAAVAAVAKSFARRHGATLQPIAISLHPAEDDRRAFDDPPADSDQAATPCAAARVAGRCRAVVAGSYHAAVFALAQGIPAVALAASPYYADKLNGLREQFGAGCRVVELDRPGALDAIGPALDAQWRRADELEADLRAAALRQVERGHGAYERLGRLA